MSALLVKESNEKTSIEQSTPNFDSVALTQLEKGINTHLKLVFNP